MAITNDQKLDYLWKKIGYGIAKTDVSAIKSAVNESIPSPLLLRADRVWAQSGSIPGTRPTNTQAPVEVYDDTGGGQPTVTASPDLTASTNRTWRTNLTDWIPPEFGSTYLIRVYAAPAGTINPATNGTQLFAAGSNNNDEWFFDYQSGVLNFIGTNLPAAVAGNVIYITGARYTGAIGITGGDGGGTTYFAGTGVTIVNNTIGIGQAVTTNSNVLFNNVTANVGVIRGNLEITGRLLTFGNAQIVGNLTAGNIEVFKIDSYANISTTGRVNIINVANSYSTLTGALIVGGGAGIGTNLHVGGNIFGNFVSSNILQDTNNTATLGTLTLLNEFTTNANVTLESPFLTARNTTFITGNINSGIISTGNSNIYLASGNLSAGNISSDYWLSSADVSVGNWLYVGGSNINVAAGSTALTVRNGMQIDGGRFHANVNDFTVGNWTGTEWVPSGNVDIRGGYIGLTSNSGMNIQTTSANNSLNIQSLGNSLNLYANSTTTANGIRLDLNGSDGNIYITSENNAVKNDIEISGNTGLSIFANGNINYNPYTSTDMRDAALAVTGGAAISGNALLGGNVYISGFDIFNDAGNLEVTTTQDIRLDVVSSKNSSLNSNLVYQPSGAITTTGGIAANGNIVTYQDLTVAGNIYVAGQMLPIASNTSQPFTVTNNLDIAGNTITLGSNTGLTVNANTATNTVTFSTTSDSNASVNIAFATNTTTTGNSRVTGNISSGNVIANVVYATEAFVVTGNTGTSQLSNTEISTLTVNTATVRGNVTAANANVTNILTANNFTATLATLTNLTVTANTRIQGNLNIDGNLVYIGVDTLRITDPIIEQGRGANGAPISTNDGFDRGALLWHYNNQEMSAFVGYDNSAGELIAAHNVTVSNTVVTVGEWGTFRVGNLQAQSVTTSSNVNAGNITVSTGQISSNVITANSSTIAANLSAGNITTLGQITVAGNITGNANIGAANIVATANVVATGNIQGNYILGNGSQLTGISSNSIYFGNTNVRVQTNLVTLGNETGTLVTANLASATVTVTGNIAAGNIATTAEIAAARVTATGNVTAANVTASNNVVAPRIEATSVVTNNLQVVANSYLSTVFVTGNISAGNIDATNIAANNLTLTTQLTVNNVAANTIAANAANVTEITGTNVTLTGNITASGNVNANYYLGNARYLTGFLFSTNSIYDAASNTNVTAGNGFVTIGNPAGNIATFNMAATAANSTVVLATGTTFSNLGITTLGQVTAASLVANAGVTAVNATVTNTSTLNVATANVLTLAGNLTVPANNIGITIIPSTAIKFSNSAWVYSRFNTEVVDANTYIRNALNFVVNGNSASDTITLRFNHSSDNNASWDDDNRAYVFSNASAALNRNVIITGNTTLNGALNFSSNTPLVITNTTAATSTITGAVTVAGGISTQGNIWAGGRLVIGSNIASTNASDGAVVIAGGVGIAGSLNTGPNATVFAANTEDATSETGYSGAIRTFGGASVAKTLWAANIGAARFVKSSLIPENVFNLGSESNGWGNVYIDSAGLINIGGVVITRTSANTATVNANLVVAANLTAANVVSNDIVTANQIAANTAAITGNITAGNIAATTAVTAAQATITNANIVNTLTVGTVAATGNITANNATITNAVAAAAITATGNVTANNLLGNLTATTAGITTLTAANTTITGNTVFSNVTAATSTNTGAVVLGGGMGVAGNLHVGGNIVGNIIATNIQLGNLAVANQTITGTQTDANIVLAPNGAGFLTTPANFSAGNIVTRNATVSNIIVSGNATVQGNLNVNGNLTYVNVDTLAIRDPLIEIGGGANAAPLTVNDNLDRGSALRYFDTAARTAFVGYDISANAIVAATNVSIANNVVTVETLGTLQAGNISAETVTTTGNVAAANVNVTSNIAAANISATTATITNVSAVNATLTTVVAGNITANNTVANAITANNSLTTNVLTANTGNITSVTATNVTANLVTTINVAISNTATVNAIAANTIAANVVNVNAIVSGNITSNANIAGGNLSITSNIAAGNITAATNIAGGNATFTGTVTANSIISNTGLTVANLSSNIISLNVNAAAAVSTGQIAWNATDNTQDIGLQNGVVLQAGQELHMYGKAVGAIPNGSVVEYVGSEGNHVTFRLANIASINYNDELILGVATQTFADNDFGYVTTFGKVRGLNTELTGWTEGAILYVDPAVPGGLTATKPTAPTHAYAVATVLRRHAQQGVILVRVLDGRGHINDLSDVEITNIDNHHYLSFVTANSRWENRSLTIVDDTAPQLGGNLAAAGFNIANVTNVTVVNTVSTTTLVANTGNITNVAATLITATGNITTTANLNANGATFTTGNITFGTGNITSNGYVRIQNTTQSASYNDGAMVVEGGLAVGRAINTGNHLRVWSSNASTGTDSGALIVHGGAGIAGDLNLGGLANITGNLSVSGTSNLNNIISGNISSNNIITTTGNIVAADIIANNTATANAVVANTATITGNTTANNLIASNGVVATTVTTTTARINSNLVVGNITANGNTISNSTSTGTVVVTGGVGVSGNLNVGGNAFIAGNLTVQGNTITLDRINVTINDAIITIGNNSSTSQELDGAGFILGNNNVAHLLWEHTTQEWHTMQGLGANGNITAYTNLRVLGNTVSADSATGALTVVGGVGIGGNLNTGANSLIRIANTSAATNATGTTGALGVAGGASIAGDVWIGGNLSVGANITSGLLGNLRVVEQTITGLAANANIILSPNGTGSISTNAAVYVNNTITAVANITANNLNTTTNISAGNITVNGVSTLTGNVTISSNASVTANIVAGNVSTTRLVTTGNIDNNAGITSNGTVTAVNYIANANATINNNLTVVSNASIGNVIVTRNISGNRLDITSIVAQGSLQVIGNTFLANANAGNIAVTANVDTANITVSNTARIATLITTGNLTANNITANVNIAGGNLSLTGSATIDSNLTVSRNLRVLGNLAVDGNLVYVNVDALTVRDPLIELGTGANAAALTTNDTLDRGVLLRYFDTAAKSAFIGFDNSASEIVIASNTTVVNNVVTVNSYNTLRAGNLQVENTSVGRELQVNGNAVITTTTQSSNVATGALQVRGGVGISANTNIGGNLAVTANTDITGNLAVTANTNITGTATVLSAFTANANSTLVGNARLQSNLEVTNNVWARNVVYLTSNINAISANRGNLSGALQVTGGASFSGDVFILGNIIANLGDMAANTVTIVSDRAAPIPYQANTGALSVNGGVSIAGNISSNGNLGLAGTITLTNTAVGTGNSNVGHSFTLSGGAAFNNNVVVQGVTYINNNTTSPYSQTQAGALQVRGGAGIAGNLNVGGRLVVNDTSDSTTLGLNSLETQGGLGVFGNIYGAKAANVEYLFSRNTTANNFIAGNLSIGGNLSFSGTFSSNTYGTFSNVAESNVRSNITMSDVAGGTIYFTGNGTGTVTDKNNAANIRYVASSNVFAFNRNVTTNNSIILGGNVEIRSNSGNVEFRNTTTGNLTFGLDNLIDVTLANVSATEVIQLNSDGQWRNANLRLGSQIIKWQDNVTYAQGSIVESNNIIYVNDLASSLNQTPGVTISESGNINIAGTSQGTFVQSLTYNNIRTYAMALSGGTSQYAVNSLAGASTQEARGAWFSADGLTVYYVSATSGTGATANAVIKLTSAIAWRPSHSTATNVQTFRWATLGGVLATLAQPEAIAVKPDGLGMVIAAGGGMALYQFTMGAAHSLTQVTYSGTVTLAPTDGTNALGGVITGIRWSLGGYYLHLSISDYGVVTYLCETPYSVLGTVTQVATVRLFANDGTTQVNPRGLDFNSLGTTMVVTSYDTNTTNRLHVYQISRPFDLTSIVATSATSSHNSFVAAGQHRDVVFTDNAPTTVISVKSNASWDFGNITVTNATEASTGNSISTYTQTAAQLGLNNFITVNRQPTVPYPIAAGTFAGNILRSATTYIASTNNTTVGQNGFIIANSTQVNATQQLIASYRSDSGTVYTTQTVASGGTANLISWSYVIGGWRTLANAVLPDYTSSSITAGAVPQKLANGSVRWAAVSSTVPATTNVAGQVLTLTSSGYAWQNPTFLPNRPHDHWVLFNGLGTSQTVLHANSEINYKRRTYVGTTANIEYYQVYTYVNGNVSTKELRLNSTTGTLVATQTYTRDAGGNVTQKTVT